MELLTRIKDLGRRRTAATQQCDRKVFAHYMIGLTCDQTAAQWAHDIKAAMEAGIDGFALNIGPYDHWTDLQLNLAYEAAEKSSGFTVFISFDMACGSWSVSQVVDLINRHKTARAQTVVDGKPLVSTFEGPDWADNWSQVRIQTGDISLVPDWSSLGPHGVGKRLHLIDGAFSWDAWPKAGQSKMTSTEDLLYKENLRGKKYMMGVGPWFYTRDLAQWNKNWHCPSESLWYDRWKQVMEIMPDFVQIITWNDFGESSYICDIAREQIVEGAEPYVLGQSHAAFRSVLPFLISAYKAGSTKVTLVQKDIAIAWYRTAPVRCIQDNGTVWGQGGSILAACGARDVVSVMAVTKGAASITVAIGKSYKVVFETQEQDPISYFEVPFGSHTTGAVVISMNGKSTVGPEITDGAGDCNASLNAVAIQV